MCQENGKKGFFAKLCEKIDKKMKAKASGSSCCCCSQPEGQDKKDDQGGGSCC